jgi:DNA-binding beta-propeller fold protein YncE/mono/diheme cytochrome c family protein
MTRVPLYSLACSLSLSILACGGDGPTPDPDIGVDDLGVVDDLGAPDLSQPDQGGPPPVVARRAGRSASIAVDEDATTIAVANRATDDVTFFDLATRTERARVAVGDEPTAVLFNPSGDSLFVLNAADGTVTEIERASGSAPRVARTHTVGPEPMGAALSPTGRFLYVSSWTGGSIHILDTMTRTVERVVLGGAPYAVCVTNDGDDADIDETVYVTDFYSHAGTGREGTDGSRNARVFRLDANGDSLGDVTLAPLAVSGVEAAIDAANTQAFPNQLYACAIANDHLYVTAVGASPAAFSGGTDFRQNVHGLVYAVSLNSNAQVEARTVNLSQLVSALAAPKRFVPVPVSIEFVEGTQFAYIASMTSDAVLRIDYGMTPPRAGSPSGATFLATAQMPTGIAIAGAQAFVYNEVSRSISRIDLATQTTPDMSIASAPAPVDVGEQAELRGQRFFTTGLGRWSSNGWVSCVSCHPGGTTDNVTWVFPAGPRQTSDTSATFDSSGSVQRILNWTAIFDEVHDFELNTRGVAGGVGAIVSNAALDVANRIDFVGAGGIPNPANGFNVGSAAAVAATGAVPDDWDDIEAYIRTLRSLNGDPGLEGDPVAGRAVFMTANCQNCHGGALWTLSERYFQPVLNGDLRTLTLAAAGVATIGDVRADQVVTTDTSAMSVLQNDANGAPQRHTCVVRDVGTFDAGASGRGAAEVRQSGTAAQGVDGFNVPSLLNIGLGAPYLHNGAAETLEELLDPSGEYTTHLRAGNQVFTPSAQELLDLVAFLRTIDDGTTTIPVPAGQRFCPEGVSPPVP